VRVVPSFPIRFLEIVFRQFIYNVCYCARVASHDFQNQSMPSCRHPPAEPWLQPLSRLLRFTWWIFDFHGCVRVCTSIVWFCDLPFLFGPGYLDLLITGSSFGGDLHGTCPPPHDHSLRPRVGQQSLLLAVSPNPTSD
jgi:hypothetical protein